MAPQNRGGRYTLVVHLAFTSSGILADEADGGEEIERAFDAFIKDPKNRGVGYMCARRASYLNNLCVG